jgi:hypothetical protein
VNAARTRTEAVSRVEATRDPLAASSLWREFAGDHSHHGLIAGVLSRIETAESSQMLAALAVYSLDEKARVSAGRALQGRDSDAFSEKLVLLLNAPLRYQVGEVSDPTGGRAKVLLVEGERTNYQLLYPSAARPDAFCGVNTGFLPSMVSGAEAQQFNQAQEQMARALSDQQLDSDKAAVEALNKSIRSLNERVAQLLGSTIGARLGPNDPEAWRRWLAQRQGKTYEPPDSRSKPTIAQIVEPLYTPTFLPVPAPS